MPRIPSYQAQLGASRATTATVESGLTYMPFVNEVNRTGGMLENRGAQLLQEYDTTRAYTAFNELRETSRSKMAELMSREGISAQGAQQEYDEFYKKAKAEVTKSTINAFSQRQLFDKLSQSHQAGDLDQLARHEYIEHKKYKDTVVKGYIATVERDIRENVNDDDKMNGMIYGKVEPDGTVVPGLWGAIDALGQGIDRTAAKIAATEGARYAAMDELIDTNPKRAEAKLEEWKTELGDKYAPLKKRLEAQRTDNKMALAYENLFNKFGKNADAAMSWLAVPSNQQALGLDFKEVNQLHGRFSQIASDRERAERNGRESLQRVQDDNDRKALQAQFDPTAPPIDINALHRERKMSTPMYEKINRMKETSESDNPFVFGELHDDINRGIDVTQRVSSAVADGLLSKKSAASILKNQVDEKYKREAANIARVMKPSDLDFSADKRIVFGDAMRLFDSKLASGMGYEQAGAEVRAVYLDDVRRSSKHIATPEGITYEQKNDLTALENSKMLLAEKYRTGKISATEYNERMAHIDALVKIAIEEQESEKSNELIELLRKQGKVVKGQK